MKKFRKAQGPLLLLILSSGLCLPMAAQISLTGQVRTRTEFRNGLGTLRPKTNSPSFFTSQRTRLTANYKLSRVELQMSIQDVRVWGQDASTISNADGARLGLHEGWARFTLADRKDSSFKQSSVDYFAVKIGRQELMYDDSRLLGNLDWLQQARRHDALVFQLRQNEWTADLGAAFNQNTDAFNYNGTAYLPANIPAFVKDSRSVLVPVPAGMLPLTNGSVSSKTGNPAIANPPSTNGLNQAYKSLQFLYLARQFKKAKLTGLVVADHFGKYSLDSVQTSILDGEPGYVYGRRYNIAGVNSRITAGLLANIGLTEKLSAVTGFYYQTGHDRDGAKISAYTSTVSLKVSQKKISWTLGWDYVSGNDASSPGTVNHRFDPLYGTPHKFWGAMDYFYVGTGSPAGGLSDNYLGVAYKADKKRFTLAADLHYFRLANKQKSSSGEFAAPYLGTELDLTAQYSLNPFTKLIAGFSVMAASESMYTAKNVSAGSANLTNTWSFLMLNIQPSFFLNNR